MLKRLRSLQEQCRSKSSLLERPFCNIGHTSQLSPTPLVNGPRSLQQNSAEVVLHNSTSKQNSNLLPLDCVDTTDQDDQGLQSLTEKSSKRPHSEIDLVPSVDHKTSPMSSSPARKRSRQDTSESVASENAVTATSPSDIAVAAPEKWSVLVTSPADRSFDSTNVELSSSTFGFPRAGSGTQLSNVSRPASIVRSANSSPRTWSSRRDLGWYFVHLIQYSASEEK